MMLTKKNITLNFVFLLILIMVTPMIVADDCTYYDTETYEEIDDFLCIPNTNVVKGDALTFSNFKEGGQITFIVHNSNDYTVDTKITYNVTGFIPGEYIHIPTIQSNESKRILKNCYKIVDDEVVRGDCHLDRNSIRYKVINPETLNPCTLNINKTRKICNKKCSSDSDCISTICNIDSFCGVEKIVPCTEPKKNCENLRCIAPGSKKGGEAFDCDWECGGIASNEGICKTENGSSCSENLECESNECNFLGFCGEAVCSNRAQSCQDLECRVPSAIKNGEAYLCDWECKSGTGNGSVCQQKLFYKILFWSMLIGAIIFLLIYIVEKLNEISLEEIKKTLVEIEKNKENIKELQMRKQGAYGIAQEKINEEITKLKQENKNYNKELREKENNKEKIIKLRNDIIDEKEKIFDKHFNVLKKVYSSNQIEINDYGYPIFQGGQLIHLSVYKNEYKKFYSRKVPEGRQIHHIDKVKSNANFWNLIDLSAHQHNPMVGGVNHGKISYGDWEDGIKELLRALNWEEKDLPKHIQQHLEKYPEEEKRNINQLKKDNLTTKITNNEPLCNEDGSIKLPPSLQKLQDKEKNSIVLRRKQINVNNPAIAHLRIEFPAQIKNSEEIINYYNEIKDSKYPSVNHKLKKIDEETFIVEVKHGSMYMYSLLDFLLDSFKSYLEQKNSVVVRGYWDKYDSLKK